MLPAIYVVIKLNMSRPIIRICKHCFIHQHIAIDRTKASIDCERFSVRLVYAVSDVIFTIFRRKNRSKIVHFFFCPIIRQAIIVNLGSIYGLRIWVIVNSDIPLLACEGADEIVRYFQSVECQQISYALLAQKEHTRIKSSITKGIIFS
mgnify:CR=1 FL=1